MGNRGKNHQLHQQGVLHARPNHWWIEWQSCLAITRITIEMISRFLQHANGLKPKTLRSVAFPDVYVRWDARGVTDCLGPGSGMVNCRYKPVLIFERFYKQVPPGRGKMTMKCLSKQPER